MNKAIILPEAGKTGSFQRFYKKRHNILYGSYARGDYKKNSDIDIMILVDAETTEIKKNFNTVCDLAFDFEMNYGVVISPLVKNEKQFLRWSETLPFYKNVKKEGVDIDEI